MKSIEAKIHKLYDDNMCAMDIHFDDIESFSHLEEHIKGFEKREGINPLNIPEEFYVDVDDNRYFLTKDLELPQVPGIITIQATGIIPEQAAENLIKAYYRIIPTLKLAEINTKDIDEKIKQLEKDHGLEDDVEPDYEWNLDIPTGVKDTTVEYYDETFTKDKGFEQKNNYEQKTTNITEKKELDKEKAKAFYERKLNEEQEMLRKTMQEISYAEKIAKNDSTLNYLKIEKERIRAHHKKHILICAYKLKKPEQELIRILKKLGLRLDDTEYGRVEETAIALEDKLNYQNLTAFAEQIREIDHGKLLREIRCLRSSDYDKMISSIQRLQEDNLDEAEVDEEIERIRVYARKAKFPQKNIKIRIGKESKDNCILEL